MTRPWRPDFPKGFIIDEDTNTFIREPPGNTKTVEQVLAENRAKNATPDPVPTITDTELLDLIRRERGFQVTDRG